METKSGFRTLRFQDQTAFGYLFPFSTWKGWIPFSENKFASETDLVSSIRSLPFHRGPPGGHITYSPPRMVNTWHLNSKWHGTETCWPAAIVTPQLIAVSKLPPCDNSVLHYLSSSCKRAMKETGFSVNDELTCCSVWGNLYQDPDDHISPHTDNDEYYEKIKAPISVCDSPCCSSQRKRKFEAKTNPQSSVFVSFSCYLPPENVQSTWGSPCAPARFQVYDPTDPNTKKRWKEINLPHLSLLVMYGSVQHRVLGTLHKDRSFFCPRVNLTFRTPANLPLDQFLFLSNPTRYYTHPLKLIVPQRIFKEHKNLQPGVCLRVLKSKEVVFEENKEVVHFAPDTEKEQQVIFAYAENTDSGLLLELATGITKTILSEKCGSQKARSRVQRWSAASFVYIEEFLKKFGET